MGLILGAYKIVFHWKGSAFYSVAFIFIKYAKMILPHIGLVLLLAAYTILGAGAFHLLEKEPEMKKKDDLMKSLHETKNRYEKLLWNASRSENMTEDWKRINSEYWKEMIRKSFNCSQSQIVSSNEIINNVTWDARHVVWTFEASIFFATTVITTIGYGRMAPMTTPGRVFCIVFGLFGVPLLLMTIADIGKILSDLLSSLYRSYRSLARRLKKSSRKFSQRRRRLKSGGNDGQIDDGRSVVEYENDEGENDGEDWESNSGEDELHIPVVMVFVVLVGYTSLGGVLFQNMEKWTYFESVYFCFITMSTIGFGDFVPSKQMFMFLTMAYIVVGLALATMCIDLAGKQYQKKINIMGQKIESAKENEKRPLHVREPSIHPQQQQQQQQQDDPLLSSQTKRSGLVRAAGASDPGKRPQVLQLKTGRVMGVGLSAGSHLLKHTGYDLFRTAGGRLAVVGRGRREGCIEDQQQRDRNILFQPISPRLLRHIKNHIQLLPAAESDEEDKKGFFVVQNRIFPQRPVHRAYHLSPELIQQRSHDNSGHSDNNNSSKTLMKRSESDPAIWKTAASDQLLSFHRNKLDIPDSIDYLALIS